MADTELVQLLGEWRSGHPEALDRITPIVLAELRRLAQSYMAAERPNHTLQPTALVNEAFLRLAGDRHLDWQSRSHFIAIAANHMRHILVDHARRKLAGKRGGDAARITLKDDHAITGEETANILILNDALTRLGQMDERKLRVVEMRFFGGMELREIALVLQVHVKTVQNDLRLAKAWLKSELSRSSTSS
ncbi:MAG: ECF-type sigma factor [Bryobacteraceae bacterium]